MDMSYHTQQYLNSGNILVGNVGKTGRHAWWYDQRLEDPDKPTHFDGFIPLTVVKDRLFGWTALESVELVAVFEDPQGRPELDDEGNPKLDDNGNPIVRRILVPAKSYKALGREDWVVNGVPEGEEDGADAILSIQGDSYGTHQLKEIFITTTAEIVGGADNIGVESAGLLKWGRRAWITISIPENLHNDASGLEFRPQLTVSTSFDGSLPTSWTRTFGVPVCDNTLDYQLAKAGETGKFVLRHTKNSVGRIRDAAEALGLLTQQADEMNAALTELSKVEVPEQQFIKWLDKMVPVPELKTTTRTITSIQGEKVEVPKVNTNSQTIAMNKRDRLVEMWDRDPRVSPWKNTKLGVLQLWNTYQHHESTIKGSKALGGNKLQARVEGNMMRVITGKFAEEDAKAIQALDTVLAEMPVTVAAGGTKATATRSRSRKQNADNN
jgi:phage/plasmid-like protein (TIGR03299 family)